MSKRKLLFLSRDGTLIGADADECIDSPAKLRLVPGVIPALGRLRQAGYGLVIVSNQPCLAEADVSREGFDETDRFIRALFASQGIEFEEVLFCAHDQAQGCNCRKPAVGLVRHYLAGDTLDRSMSAVIGDRESDLEFAANMGLPGYLIGAEPSQSWNGVVHQLLDKPRTAQVVRNTRETRIVVDVDLDQAAPPSISTGLGFFDHMLEQIGKHGGFSLSIDCQGDLEVDEHHTIEDVALSLGEALRKALGDKRGIQRYGFVLPMDEAVAEVAIDIGGRAYLVFEGEFPRTEVGGLPSELVPHFFRSLSDTLGASLRITVRGENAHHMIEACFKGVARTLRQAFERRGEDLPSTKGVL